MFSCCEEKKNRIFVFLRGTQNTQNCGNGTFEEHRKPNGGEILKHGGFPD